MKQQGIYKDATIIITSDHGDPVWDDMPLQKATRIGMFYKPSGAEGTALKHSGAPVSLKNVPATIAKEAGMTYEQYGKSLDALKFQHVDDKDTILDEQTALYKKEKYSPFAGTIPLLLQLPLIFGLIDVVYRPLRHILRLPQDVIQIFTAKTCEILGKTNLAETPSLLQLDFR